MSIGDDVRKTQLAEKERARQEAENPPKDLTLKDKHPDQALPCQDLKIAAPAEAIEKSEPEIPKQDDQGAPEALAAAPEPEKSPEAAPEPADAPAGA